MDGGTEIATTLHRFSVRDYRRMAEAGVFDQLHVELIRGAIVDMAPIGTPHVWTVMLLTELFAPLLVNKLAKVSVQNSVRVGGWSEPEPDVMLLAWGADQTVHPGSDDVLLVIEVADSSLAVDREVKAALYAEAGIPEYWIVNLPERVIEVHRSPGPDGYRKIAPARSGRLAPLALATFKIAVEDVFPPVAP